jgi:predicted TPR repeat methyltransferase
MRRHRFKRGSVEFERLFENVFAYSVGSRRVEAAMLHGLFDWLSRRYSRFTTQEVNVQCYEELFRVAQRMRAEHGAPKVLDMGSGPGTIARTVIPQVAEGLWCFDASVRMRSLTRETGLKVLDPATFLSGRLEVDIVLAVYVMHFRSAHDQLIRGAVRHLEEGGVWVMNFHKERGLGCFIDAMRKCVGLELAERHTSSNFGTIVVLRRVA